MLAAMVAGAALVLGGCQSEDAPPATPSPSVTSPSPSPSPSPTPSASPTGGDVPAAARENTKKGGEAFVRYFFDQVNVAWTQPKAGVIAELGEPKCEFCVNTEETAAFLVKEKQRYDQDPLSLARVEGLTAPEGQLYFFVEGTQNRASIVDASGKVLATDPKKPLRMNVAIRWATDRWSFVGAETAG
ncbi:DUF6318 family protein [Oryzobacter telluris]|uniref:DUF6318 family protein n=1 Tax=Oryzobacter telluris TaxID=3149179 RepID=UPI00370DA193